MHSFEPELQRLQASGMLDDQTVQQALLLERGQVFSVFLELRIALYAAVLMIISGIGLFLRDHLDRIGPLTIVIILSLLALASYGGALWTQRQRVQGSQGSLTGDYVLLLGALVFSATIGYAETQFHFMGQRWLWYLLMLAVWHAVTAYIFDSRLVLTVALTSLAAWFGIEPAMGQLFAWNPDIVGSGISALSCAVALLIWHALHRRWSNAPGFLSVLEHFIINTAFWGALALSFSPVARWPGLLLTLAIAAYLIPRGLRQRAETQVVYGIVYATLAACGVVADALDGLPAAIMVLIIVIAAALLLWRLHQQLKQPPT